MWIVWSVECDMWVVGCGVWSLEYGVLSVGVKNGEYLPYLRTVAGEVRPTGHVLTS